MNVLANALLCFALWSPEPSLTRTGLSPARRITKRGKSKDYLPRKGALRVGGTHAPFFCVGGEVFEFNTAA